jgi:DtxR family Mn-dependent transcriptional regulator
MVVMKVSTTPAAGATRVSDLIDTTEMYLRTIYELEEEGIVPLRARIAERLGQSGPTVSQTVARMERDGLLKVEGDRHLELSRDGRALAIRVMRKHRLAERLLVDVIGLEWEHVHAEACRWEHVMSDAVERRLLQLLDHPTESPYGNPIPGMQELGEAGSGGAFIEQGMVNLRDLAGADDLADPAASATVVVRRIGEPLQSDEAVMARLNRAGVRPGSVVRVARSAEGVSLASGGEATELDLDLAGHVFVARPSGACRVRPACPGRAGAPARRADAGVVRGPAGTGSIQVRYSPGTGSIPTYGRPFQVPSNIRRLIT